MNLANLESRYEVGLRHNTFIHKINKGKYQINLLSIVLYYRKLGRKLFYKKIWQYLHDTTIHMKWIDIKFSIKGLLKLFINQANQTRKIQQIEK